MELSLIIPARSEIFLKDTIEDALKNIEAYTDIIVLLDGKWSEPPIIQHDRVNIIYVSKPIGQRAGANLACKLSKSKYIMKVDAHCSFDKGFDRKMLEAFKISGDNVTMVPTMKNLHAFDWRCHRCGWRKYQGPTPQRCGGCNDSRFMRRKMMWIGKPRPNSSSFSFDSEPHFAYNNELTKRKGYDKGIIIGYNLSIDFIASDSLKDSGSTTQIGTQPSLISSIVNLLADLTSSHQFTSSSNFFRFGENMSVNTVGLSSVDSSGGVGVEEIVSVGNESQVDRITTSPILTDMVNNRNVLSSTSGNGTDEPGVSNSVCKGFLSEMSTPTITPLIYPPFPIPTSRSTINSDVINKFNSVLGGEFVYNEKTSSFHNGSVALTPVYDNGLTETMSLQGSSFMCTREKFWELDLGGEELGNWGNQGLQVACATWLSGGRVLVNHRTWYAHMFRTQGLDFGFPYELSGRETQRTKSNVRDLFWHKKHPKQIYPVSWLVEKFAPVTGWDEESLNKLKEIESHSK